MRHLAGIFRSINSLIPKRSNGLNFCFPKVVSSSYNHFILARNDNISNPNTLNTCIRLSKRLTVIDFIRNNCYYARNFHTSPNLLLSKDIDKSNRNGYTEKVLIVDTDGRELGKMVLKEAVNIAKEKSQYLVQMQDPQAKIPIIYKLVSPKRISNSETNGKRSKLKALTITGRIASQDLKWKIKKISDFLENGHSVKLSITRKPYQKISQEEKMEIVKKVVEEVKDFGILDGEPKMIGSLALRCNLKPVVRKTKTY